MAKEMVSRYIIDGVPQDLTPAQLLSAVSECPCEDGQADTGTIIDETLDLPLESFAWAPSKVDDYSVAVESVKRRVPLPFAGTWSRCRVASAVLDSLWRTGHFKLEDIALKVDWKWNTTGVGANAAFYDSVQAVSDYTDALGLKLNSYSFVRTDGASGFIARTVLGGSCEEDLFEDGVAARMGTRRACPSHMEADPRSWLIWVPFDTSDFRLGGSLLAQAVGAGGGVAPQITDADYFMDCYEVLRELVEDKVILSGTTVSDGGLITAVRRMAENGPGITIDISDAVRAFDEDNAVRLLFSEVPGVVFQIADIDFDYIDAEFLLQDVAYFPLGHPDPKKSSVRVKSSGKSSIQTIIESLMQNAEGED